MDEDFNGLYQDVQTTGCKPRPDFASAKNGFCIYKGLIVKTNKK